MQLARDAVGAVFGAAENQHLIVVGAPQQFFQQFLFLADVHGIQSVRHRLGRRRRRPISIVSGLRNAQRHSCSISGGMVAENSIV